MFSNKIVMMSYIFLVQTMTYSYSMIKEYPTYTLQEKAVTIPGAAYFKIHTHWHCKIHLKNLCYSPDYIPAALTPLGQLTEYQADSCSELQLLSHKGGIFSITFHDRHWNIIGLMDAKNTLLDDKQLVDYLMLCLDPDTRPQAITAKIKARGPNSRTIDFFDHTKMLIFSSPYPKKNPTPQGANDLKEFEPFIDMSNLIKIKDKTSGCIIL